MTVVHPSSLTDADRAAWRGLSDAQRPAVNPFLTPTWALAWYETYVAPADRLVLLVHDPKTGRLIGVAALYREVIGIGPARLATRLLPVGAGLTTAFEIPGYSAEPGRDREVLRALVRHCLSLDADWSVVAIAPGMFETAMIAGLPGAVRERLLDMVLEPRRMGDPAEFAALVEHIVANRYLNAETIRIDGGIRMQPK